MKMNKETQIKDFIAVYPSLTKLFIENHVDYCCNGHRTLLEASVHHGFDVDVMLLKIEKVISQSQSTYHFNEILAMNVQELENYIENKHHTYIKEKLPIAHELITKIVRAHGVNHSELLEVSHVFGLIQADLNTHLLREEIILFPMFSEMKSNEETQEGINILKKEHEQVGEYIHRLQHLTHDYLVPDDACPTFKKTYELLQEIQEDIFMHIYLENSVLFEKVGG